MMTPNDEMPKPKRFRNSFEKDFGSPSSKDVMISPQSQSTMMQLTGQFSVVMDLWTDFPTLDVESIDDDELDDILLAEVTDEEMNKFWDTLPKEYGGLM